ncbi:hypothetical protein [Embleya sp. NPDC059237]|uniref:hypothetical protein n=1 Tax=Embleya sp. NPDC059237 TaxID=3346784 RepID=UPI0036BE1B3B
MGLDFSHTDAHWSYSGFMRFREAIAAHEGIDLWQMQGFNSGPDAISWSTVTSPLKALLNHSDCDGHLTPEECAVVAPGSARSSLHCRPRTRSTGATDSSSPTAWKPQRRPVNPSNSADRKARPGTQPGRASTTVTTPGAP